MPDIRLLAKKEKKMYKLILASQSPRRRELLKMLGIEFDIKVSNCEEIITSSEPAQVTMELAKQKALAVANELVKQKAFETEIADVRAASEAKNEENIIIIGADTVVAADGEILGKPKDKDDARRMINKISGTSHQVYTGVALVLVKDDKAACIELFAEKTDVEVCEMSSQEIDDYISSEEPYDKAGGYGIQGIFSKFVSGIRGDYNNVVGLPVHRLYYTLKECAKSIADI